MWLNLLAYAAEVSIRWPGAERQTGGAGTEVSASPGQVLNSGPVWAVAEQVPVLA